MILINTQYKIYDGKLLAIVKIFKTYCHYLKICNHKLIVFID